MWVLALLSCGACGAKASTSTGIPAPADQDQGCVANPYGACYPTEDVGRTPLVIDANGNVLQRGERITNLRFTGFPAASAASIVDATTLRTISLADLYDPESRKIRLIHVMGNTMWCGPSNEEADFVAGADYTGQNTGGAAFARELEPLGVVFLEVLIDGPTLGTAPTPANLRDWVTHHQVDYDVAMDVGGWSDSLFGSYATTSFVPFEMNIDPRSMEILSIDSGFDASLDVTLRKWLDWESAHPAL
jgi:hypothetical protein